MSYFSVVIPAYNVQDYIAETLVSVFAQTFTDFEVVVVNDGSTDHTSEVLAGITDSRLRIINQANGGECRARNRGMAEAKGRFLAFLDADDIWLPYHLQLAHGFFESHPDACWYASIPKGFRGEMPAEMLKLPSPAVPRFQMKSFYDGVSILPSSTCILRSAVKEANLFEPDMKSGGDRMGWLRFCLTTGDGLGILQHATVYYRTQRPGAATALGEGYNEKFVKVYLNSMKVGSGLMRDLVPNGKIRAFLRRENSRHWGWCIRHSILQGWNESLQVSDKLIGWMTAWPLRFFSYLHFLITCFFYLPFYLLAKIQKLK